MRTVEVTFAAGETHQFPGGNFFMVLEAPAPVDVQFFRHGTQVDDKAVAVEAGFIAQPKRRGDGLAFDSVEITSATAQTVKVVISQGTGSYQRLIGEVAVKKDTGLSTAVDHSMNTAAYTAQLLTANANRRVAIITNLEGNPVSIRVGDSTATVSAGIPVRPGETLTLETTAAIYAYKAATAAQMSVAITEITS